MDGLTDQRRHRMAPTRQRDATGCIAAFVTFCSDRMSSFDHLPGTTDFTAASRGFVISVGGDGKGVVWSRVIVGDFQYVELEPKPPGTKSTNDPAIYAGLTRVLYNT